MAAQDYGRVTQTRVVVVLDVYRTSEKNQARLLREAHYALNVLKRNSNASFIFLDSFGRAVRRFDFAQNRNSGANRDFLFFIREGLLDDDLGMRGNARAVSFYLFGVCELASMYPLGPTRVVWISEMFDWFDYRILRHGGHRPYKHKIPDDYRPNEAYYCLEELCRSGVTVFPIVLPQPGKQRPSRRHLGEAKYLAKFTGGFATVAAGPPGETFRKVLEASSDGYLVKIAGPPVGRRYNGAAPELKIVSRAPNARFEFRRPFVVAAPGQIQIDPEYLRKMSGRVVGGRTLRVKAGCQVHEETSREPKVRLLLPDHVLRAPAGKLRVFVEYLGAEPGWKQRLSLDRPHVETPAGGEGETLCVRLAEAKDGTKFWIAAYDEVTDWAASVTVTIVGVPGRQAPVPDR